MGMTFDTAQLAQEQIVLKDNGETRENIGDKYLMDSLQNPNSKNHLSNLPRLLIFSFDGFRADALSASVTPTLYSLAATGVTGHMRPTFPSKTFPNHHSIATGLYQPFHGVVNNIFIDPETADSNEEKFSVDNGSAFWWDMYDRNVPLYIANQVFEPGRRFSGTLQWPGATSTYTSGEFFRNSEDSKDNSRTRHQSHYLLPFSRSLNWTAAIDLIFDRWLLSPSSPANLIMVYFHEPDSTSHDHGPFSPEVRQQLVRLDRTVEYFLRRLREVEENIFNSSTNLLFISDHGMAEITPERVIHLERCAEVLGPAPEEFFRKSSGSNLVQAVQSALNHCSRKLFNGKFTVYQQAEIPPSESTRKADGKRIPKGNHGFNNSLPSMRPLFIACGPAFKSGGGGYHHWKVFENVDLYPLALELLAIPGHLFPSNGSLERVAGLLRGGGGFCGDEEDEDEAFGGKVHVMALFQTILFAALLFSLLFTSQRRLRGRY
ncbi:hypothetical protein TYRP_019848 [Tyrophagus putrescentiae]|nr:hypothetical protein TYRP_019848 [Tyrophagus putrescentiae]